MTYVYDGQCSRSFANKECIEALYDLLTYPDPKIVTVCLKGLENILSAGEINNEWGPHYGVNIYAQMVEDCGGLHRIASFHSSDNNDIFDRATWILAKHWPVELEIDDDNRVTGSEKGFSFRQNLPSGSFNFYEK